MSMVWKDRWRRSKAHGGLNWTALPAAKWARFHCGTRRQVELGARAASAPGGLSRQDGLSGTTSGAPAQGSGSASGQVGVLGGHGAMSGPGREAENVGRLA